MNQYVTGTVIFDRDQYDGINDKINDKKKADSMKNTLDEIIIDLQTSKELIWSNENRTCWIKKKWILEDTEVIKKMMN